MVVAMSKEDIVESIRTVYDDTEELASWCDTDTYEGAEIRTHLIGLYEAALEACNEIERLKRENAVLREELQYRLEEIYGVCYSEMTDEEAEEAAEQYITHMVLHNEGAE
jgi:predicted nuclease with TOPRIM domain